jgi:predicted AlkP superfamily phosphohydrolase/phosphomutase
MAASVLAAGVSCGGAETSVQPKLVVLAVDGLDHSLTDRLISQGRLPNMGALARANGVGRVIATPGAEGSAAWASFLTGVNPGKHGIFDLVVPDPASRRPALSGLVARPSSRWFDRWWTEGSAYAVMRAREPFWTPLGRTGLRAHALFVPGTFPPEPIESGEVIAGSPLPDLGGGIGGYAWLATDVAPGEVGPTRFGGRVVQLSFERNVAEAAVPGIRLPEPRDLPVRITWNREARSANIVIADASVHLAEGQQSRWLEVNVALNVAVRVGGLVRLHLLRAGNDLQLYVSPVQWHPARPPSAISSPQAASRHLFDRLGPFRTLTWPEAGWALADGRITEESFIGSLDETFDDRAESLLNRVDSRGWDLIVAGVETLDHAQHLLWRLVDPGHALYNATLAARFRGVVERTYARIDTLVGDVRRRLPAGADLVVMSAYGTYTTRQVVDVNRWLASEGLLAWHRAPGPATLAALGDATAGSDAIDWSRTSARAMGFGGIRLNVAGRDPSGIVEPGADYEALLDRLARGLEALTDPISGRRVVSRVRQARTLYAGPLVTSAPDLLVTFSPGYRITWDTVLGAAAPDVIAPNSERWSADHASVDENAVAGAWLSTFEVAESLSVLDAAPTILQYFGVAPPPDLDGISRLVGRSTPSRTP